MTSSLIGRDFLAESEFSAAELTELMDLADSLKSDRKNGTERQRLVGKNIAMIFEKTSTRTRIAFEAAAFQQGGHTTFLDSSSSQIGHKESIADTARVLDRVFDAIQFRGYEHAAARELAEYSSVPVYNGLTDSWHPTQMLADFMTMREHSMNVREHAQGSFNELSYAYLGDARFNMGNSLLVMGAIMGSDVRIVAPKSLWPDIEVQALATSLAAASGARITLTEDVAEGVHGAQFVHTDVWVSMGEPKDVWDERVALLKPYRVTAEVMAATENPGAKFMHCLPAFHDEDTIVGRDIASTYGLLDGVEVSNDVFESPASIVFDQSENRLHSIKAVMVATIGTD